MSEDMSRPTISVPYPPPPITHAPSSGSVKVSTIPHSSLTPTPLTYTFQPSASHRGGTRYKEKFQALREKYDQVTAAHTDYERALARADDKLRRLQEECNLLLDAVDIAVPAQPSLVHYLKSDPIAPAYYSYTVPVPPAGAEGPPPPFHEGDPALRPPSPGMGLGPGPDGAPVHMHTHGLPHGIPPPPPPAHHLPPGPPHLLPEHAYPHIPPPGLQDPHAHPIPMHGFAVDQLGAGGEPLALGLGHPISHPAGHAIPHRHPQPHPHAHARVHTFEAVTQALFVLVEHLRQSGVGALLLDPPPTPPPPGAGPVTVPDEQLFGEATRAVQPDVLYERQRRIRDLYERQRRIRDGAGVIVAGLLGQGLGPSGSQGAGGGAGAGEQPSQGSAVRRWAGGGVGQVVSW
ncbi:hypothetical protein V8D89_002634 [Ganoderma adspersum]